MGPLGIPPLRLRKHRHTERETDRDREHVIRRKGEKMFTLHCHLGSTSYYTRYGETTVLQTPNPIVLVKQSSNEKILTIVYQLTIVYLSL